MGEKNKTIIILGTFVSLLIIFIAGCNQLGNNDDLAGGSEHTAYINIDLIVSDNLGGQVTGGGLVKAGETINIIAKPDENYIFKGWYIDGKQITTSLTHNLELQDDTEIHAKFSLEEGKYKVLDGDDYLSLVTKDTDLGQYRPNDLVEIPKHMLSRPQWRYYLREEAAVNLEKMWDDANDEGIELYVHSAFRDFETQQSIFNNAANRYGEELANRKSARPGQSEHQLGTAVDFVERPDSALLQSFSTTPAGKWLADNAYKYGFALSYPENKESVTGYIFEPWHYRYIGVEAAHEWKESGLTLNEFLKTKPQQLENINDHVTN